MTKGRVTRMGLFRRNKNAPEQRTADMAATLIALADGGRRGGSGTAGQVVTNDTAMQLMAVWRCRHLIADVVSGLPLDQFRRVDKGRGVEIPKSEFVAEPSQFVSPEEWRYQLTFSAVSTGNALGFATDHDTRGTVRKAEVLDWGDVTVTQRGALAAPAYRVNGRLVDYERCLHLRAFGPRPGSVLGMNPIEYARRTIGLGLAVRDFGSSWYESGGHPTTLLTTEQTIDQTQATEAKDAFRNATRDDHIAVLGNAWDLKSVQVSPDDALFLGATNATSVDICGYHGIPPEMLGYAAQGGGAVTYANREQRAIDLLVWTLQWWIGRVERLISRQLPADEYVKINVDALLRSDALTRWTVHDKSVRLGARNVDEVRDLENQTPLPDGAGQQFLWPPSAVTVTAPTNDEGGAA